MLQLRRLRQRIVRNPRTAIGLTLVGMASLYAVTRGGDNDYCHEFPATAYPGYVLMANVTNPNPTTLKQVAASLQESLNATLEKAMGYDNSILRDQRTGDIIGRVAGRTIVPFPFTEVDAKRLPNRGKMFFLIGPESRQTQIVVSETARFVVAEDLSKITIDGKEIPTPRLPAIGQRVLRHHQRIEDVIVLPIVYLAKGALFVCRPDIPRPRNILIDKSI